MIITFKKISFILLVLSLLATTTFAGISKEEEALFVARRALEDSFYDVSLTLLKRFLEKYPKSPLVAEANFYIGQCYYYQKKYLEALSQFKQLLDSSSKSSLGDKLYYWLAEAYFKIGDFKQAGGLYEKLLLEYPNSVYGVHTFYSLGWCLSGQGKFEAAKEKFIEFKNKFPQDTLAEEAAFKAAECLYNLKSYAELKEYLESFSREYPKSTKTAFLKYYLAESSFYTQDYSSAITNYNKAQNDTSDVNLINLIFLGLGWSYLKSENYVDAKANFDKVIQASLDKKNTDSALLGEAVILQANSQFKQAADIYTKLIKEGSAKAVVYEAYLAKAEALCQLGDYKEASLVYKEAEGYIERDVPAFLAGGPDASTTSSKGDVGIDRLRYGLGLCYLKSGSLQEAQQEFSFLIKDSKNNSLKVAALSRLAGAYLDVKDTEKATKICEDILKNYPEDNSYDYVRYILGIGLLNSKRYNQAIEVLKEMIAKYPASKMLEEAEFYLASAHFETEDFLNSYLRLDSFAHKYPSSEFKPRALLLEGLSLKSLNRFQDAHDIFKAILKDYNKNAHILARAELEIADCLSHLGRRQEALEKLESLRSKYTDPETSSIVLWRLSEYYFKENNFDLCKRYLLGIIQEYPQSDLLDDAYYTLGLCFQKQGRYKEALDSFKKIKEKEIFGIYAKIAEVYKTIGEYAQAASYYRLGLNEKTGDKLVLQFKLAECLEESNNLDEALIEYSKIPVDSPQGVKGLLRSGQILENQESWPDAISVYNKIIKLNVEEAKFAKERIAFIEAAYLAGN